MLVVEMLRQRFARDVTEGRPLFGGARYLAEAVAYDDPRWRKAVALLREQLGEGDEVLAVHGEAFDTGTAFVAGRAGLDWILVGTADCW